MSWNKTITKDGYNDTTFFLIGHMHVLITFRFLSFCCIRVVLTSVYRTHPVRTGSLSKTTIRWVTSEMTILMTMTLAMTLETRTMTAIARRNSVVETERLDQWTATRALSTRVTNVTSPLASRVHWPVTDTNIQVRWVELSWVEYEYIMHSCNMKYKVNSPVVALLLSVARCERRTLFDV